MDKMDSNVYIQNGYKSRGHYLECISEDYNVPIEAVYSLLVRSERMRILMGPG